MYVSRNMSTVLFADDTTLLFRHENFQQLIQSCNSELEKFRQWCISNRLSLNVEKTCALVSSNRTYDQNFRILFGNSPIRICSEFAFLGVKIDSHLKFTSHTRDVCNKVSKNVGILYKLSNYVSKLTLRSIYFSLIFPYLSYCNIAWGNAFTVHLNRNVKLQKRAVRIFCKAHFKSHTDKFLKS